MEDDMVLKNENRRRTMPDRRHGRRATMRLSRAAGSLVVRFWGRKRRHPVDVFTVLAASLVSIFIIINAVFLQPGSRSLNERERLTFKVRELQNFLKSEIQSSESAINSTLAKIKIMRRRPDLDTRRGG